MTAMPSIVPPGYDISPGDAPPCHEPTGLASMVSAERHQWVAGGAVDVGLSIGIVGLPNVGKSTLFNALTKNDVLAANYPFATIDPNVGVVNAPDTRLDRLAGGVHSARAGPATGRVVGIARPGGGAREGPGLGHQFLADVREA